MPKRYDISSVLIIGSGPIAIGQGCEFDYSGTQACQALKEEGYEVILLNSNPVTIMTDPKFVDKIYVEPITLDYLKKIIHIEKPDAILPTMGGQTALNITLELFESGFLDDLNIEIIGAKPESIKKAESRQLFSDSMHKIGLPMAKSFIVHSIEQAEASLDKLDFPIIVRPSFTLGGAGGGVVYNREEFLSVCKKGLELSLTKELLLDQSLIGWKEYEMEVVRDQKDNCIIVCSIENFDPMGIHTGDSITVAPAQTLTDKEYQKMRDASIDVLREIGVETGGANVQFAINPKNGDMVVIEMNPRVSRSSALASKATGFPIAKVATKLAIGYSLDEIENYITSKDKVYTDLENISIDVSTSYKEDLQALVPASFEPSIDYVVIKIPKFNFDKFPDDSGELSTQMKSVGEVMSLGQNFQSALQKALQSLEDGYNGLDTSYKNSQNIDLEELLQKNSHKRIFYIADAFRLGYNVDKINELTFIDKWFLYQIKDIIDEEKKLKNFSQNNIEELNLEKGYVLRLKQMGFSDKKIGELLGIKELDFRKYRLNKGVKAVFRSVDSCAAEFMTSVGYFYSTYFSTNYCESKSSNKKKVLIIGSGPNRIGQGIEFDYCCVHAALAASDMGYETIMINCNPETISTDFNISNRLYFEPIILEKILDIVDTEQPSYIAIQFGGQTPLNLTSALNQQGLPLLGTSVNIIKLTEDREKFRDYLSSIGFAQSSNHTLKSLDELLEIEHNISYPVIARPSYVIGGKHMRVVRSKDELLNYIKNTSTNISTDTPLLLESFLDNAIEVDVDAVSDGEDVMILGIIEHIEELGVHSGDSSGCLPPFSVSENLQKELADKTKFIATNLNILGFINIQFAIQNDKVFIIEVNPRASRTVPFIAKATGVEVIDIAMKVMLGNSLKKQKIQEINYDGLFHIKEPVFPFNKLDTDVLLGPEMKSTGEVMGTSVAFGEAYLKAKIASGEKINKSDEIFISLSSTESKADVSNVLFSLLKLKYKILLDDKNVNFIYKSSEKEKFLSYINENKLSFISLENQKNEIIQKIENKKLFVLINTAKNADEVELTKEFRMKSKMYNLFCLTNLKSVLAFIEAIPYIGLVSINELKVLHNQSNSQRKMNGQLSLLKSYT